jgi:diguanylate cyclase (GGDEF)-like protein
LPPEITFILVTGVVAALVGLATLVAVWRERGSGLRRAADAPVGEPSPSGRPAGGSDETGDGYASAVRIMWWVSIAAVLVGVGLTDAFGPNQPALYGLGGVAVGTVLLLHDVMPARWRTTLVATVEVLAALALITALLVLTGYGASPFAPTYAVVAVAVALSVGPSVALSVAALATISFLGVLALDPQLGSYDGAGLLRVGLTVASIWLLTYLSGVFAAGERRRRELSRTDPLTGLLNRGELFELLEQEVQRTRRSERGFCLLMIDLDSLKGVNDTYGHHRGDAVLRALAEVMRRSIRSVDTAFRYAGDEFLVLLPETDFAGAYVVAEKIRAGAEDVGPLTGSDDVPTSVSIGLVSCPEDGASVEELMIAVDRAMYQAKSLGKNQVSGNPQPRRADRRIPSRAASEAAAPLAQDEQPAAAPIAEISAAHDPRPGSPAAAAAPSRLVPPAASEPARVERVPAAARVATPTLERPWQDDGRGDAVEDEEPDPGEMRRRIAAASLHMDPDHQIRRAMDTFLSPTRRED